MKFNGYLRVRIGEAVGLQPTRWSLRHSLFKKGHQLLDPYLTVSVDQVRVGQTSTKQKTNKPTYNEEFCANVTDGGHLELAVFHETPLGYDHFVANCTLQFQELLRTTGASDTFEGWVAAALVTRPRWVCADAGVSPGSWPEHYPLSGWRLGLTGSRAGVQGGHPFRPVFGHEAPTFSTRVIRKRILLQWDRLLLITNRYAWGQMRTSLGLVLLLIIPSASFAAVSSILKERMYEWISL
ncbi:hypothetical protein P7K49_018158 [Saguinus oedipus]|uniref:C2 domain-containing protein n=1 Tax=Saguinus oedipus TaxID=9490 RepID=A0ABQ9V7C0_SAGOE|nr:hypothetical protein P7K49_018158 [Saguinus oedipus]